MTERLAAGDTRLGDFADDVLAVCPSCGGCVQVVPVDEVHRAPCPACAWSGAAAEPVAVWGTPYEPWLGLPLWLQTPVAGETPWALDDAHLTVLESYVRAALRERGAYDRRRPMVEKLPAWLKSAKHRDEVLAGVARLRKRLAEA